MTDFYDKDGAPLTLNKWARLFEKQNPEYKRVDKTTLPDGKWVSTVWLGLDRHLDAATPPIIFKTSVFKEEERLVSLDIDRYSTLEEAQAGHDAMVTKWTKEKKE